MSAKSAHDEARVVCRFEEEMECGDDGRFVNRVGGIEVAGPVGGGPVVGGGADRVERNRVGREELKAGYITTSEIYWVSLSAGVVWRGE